MTNGIVLRDVIKSDLPVFYEYESDPEAVHMAAFTRQDPADRAAFDAHWEKILQNEAVTIKTIVWEGEVVGSVMSYRLFDEPQVSYWIGRAYWGRGFATQALQAFLEIYKQRPLYARAAKDNLGSIRVLEKCGFRITRYEKFYANGRGEEIDEAVLMLG